VSDPASTPARRRPEKVHNCLRGLIIGLPETVAVRGWVEPVGDWPDEVGRFPVDASGRFHVWNVPADVRFELRLGFGPGPADSSIGDGLALSDGQELELSFRLEPGTCIVGRVTDRDGRPVAGAKLTVVPAGIDWTHPDTRIRARTDADGRYVVVNARSERVPVLKVVVDAIEQGYILEETAFPTPTGGVFEVDLTLRKGLRIAGRVVDAKGRPVAGADVYLWEHYRDPEVTDRLEVRGHVKTDAEGRFEDDAFRPGSYRIVVRGEHDGSPILLVEEDVAAGREDLVLRFPGFGSLLLRFRDGRTGKPLPVMNGCLQRVYGQDGEFEEYVDWETFGNEVAVDLARVPAGDYRVRLNHRGYLPVFGDVFRIEAGQKLGPVVYAMSSVPTRPR
jgi:protocatechuate 3,4-dioxygenase beta subunit